VRYNPEGDAEMNCRQAAIVAVNRFLEVSIGIFVSLLLIAVWHEQASVGG
jgi:hypothetical protein